MASSTRLFARIRSVRLRYGAARPRPPSTKPCCGSTAPLRRQSASIAATSPSDLADSIAKWDWAKVALANSELLAYYVGLGLGGTGLSGTGLSGTGLSGTGLTLNGPSKCGRAYVGRSSGCVALFAKAAVQRLRLHRSTQRRLLRCTAVVQSLHSSAVLLITAEAHRRRCDRRRSCRLVGELSPHCNRVECPVSASECSEYPQVLHPTAAGYGPMLRVVHGTATVGSARHRNLR